MALSIPTKIGLGIVASYTSYALYVSYAANKEITKRSQLEQLKIANSNLKPEEIHGQASLIDKYLSFTVAGRFENPFEEYRVQTLFEFFLSRILELFEGKSRGNVPSNSKLRELLPIFTPDFELLRESSLKDNPTKKESSDPKLPKFQDRLTFTWLGQSCSYISISGVNFLTDPLFANYLVNPYLGPKRITPSPCKIEELPKPHFIMVSHNHPDHFDEEIADKLHNESTWIVPLGLRKSLAKKGIFNIIELDWWDRVKLPVSEDPNNHYEIVCTPAMHWSGRHLLDSNSSLWCSYVILRNNKPIFFHAGDTGYVNDLFKMIGSKYGYGLKLAMLPCGQYCPQWHQKPRHINPEECIKIMKDLKAQKIIGVHWGTFVLSSEHFLEPKLKLEELAKNLNKVYDIFAGEFGKTLVMDLSKDNEEIGEYIPIRDGKSVLIK
ncbi:N-acyl-phosphatidylethanolamine-hydrolyzing phospholipase D [Wickerhamomyces ciferrii]|uniref:N-acyl-phosphatidylethanolamine-hydrolyzing phospholipase D n=1 Tax=Wickerhamomyces ciferrii (strain ATCC 14091 / BCRC 22168 / CBS 111 / JCM 3599 / NBRC 0793 / NRRL Y-1031 F-60-10) TaxID=1206466 RepID=K0KU32_WICCF|nr:N-acyl-phosphatidylethanolamine-hydrolyzing phospholipase D [Wickerhamomyces ciferrii]CCH46691.1 N-acyl-phosphatidylethanolamine-hydrolyzing phospholipase D [Wickerhamomyces ciferrii]